MKGTFEFFDNSPPTVPTGHFVKEPPEFIHNLLLNVPREHFVKLTLDLFHISHLNVSTGHFVKETLDSIHNLLYNVPIKNLSHPSRVLSKVSINVITAYPLGSFQRTHKELTI